MIAADSCDRRMRRSLPASLPRRPWLAWLTHQPEASPSVAPVRASVGDSSTVELRTLTPSILVRIQVPQPIEFVALFTVSAIDRKDRLGEISRAVGQFVRPAFSYMSSTLVELRHKGLRSKTRRRPNPRARHLRPRKQFGCCRQCNLSWRRSDQCSGGMGICTPSFFRLGQSPLHSSSLSRTSCRDMENSIPLSLARARHFLNITERCLANFGLFINAPL